PTEGAVVIVTASYEGQPTDNARQFVAWMDSLKPGELRGVQYTVFGCGNRDWARTFQAIPKKIDEKLAAAGATRLKERGAADARGDFFGDFDHWYETLWSDLAPAFGQKAETVTARPAYEFEVVLPTRSTLLRQSCVHQWTIV